MESEVLEELNNKILEAFTSFKDQGLFKLLS